MPLYTYVQTTCPVARDPVGCASHLLLSFLRTTLQSAGALKHFQDRIRLSKLSSLFLSRKSAIQWQWSLTKTAGSMWSRCMVIRWTLGPSGRVKLLRDSDGDGRPDLTTVFADDLVMPTGVMRWKKGVLVAAAPDILVF